MSKKTILIVEDDAAAIAGYLQILECIHDVEVTPITAPSYKKAKEVLSKESVDLIILDLILSDTKATDILGELRKEHSEIPIFLVTGYPEDLELEKAMAFGLTSFFIKPVHVEPFGLAIRSSLQGA